MSLPVAIRTSAHSRLAALVLCAILLAAAPARGDGATGSPSTQNLDYQMGMEAIQASDWNRAIHDLNVASVAEPTNADLQNWLGFAYRQEGSYTAAFEHFRAALHLDPAHRRAHEYIGENYLLTGNKAKAKEHLAALLRICGKTCEEYQVLQKTIATAK